MRPNMAPTDFVGQIRFAEECGFDHAWIADVGLHRETLMMCSMAVQATSTMMIGPGVVNPYTRHPAIVAAQIATLQEISHGRSFLGLGVGGYAALHSLGIPTWRRPTKALREAITIARRLLDGEKVSFQGDFFNVVDAKIDFQPGTTVPIYLGVMLGEQGMRLVGELCDGALTVGPLGLDHTKKVVDRIKQAAIHFGRDPAKLEIAMSAPFAVSENSADAIHAAKRAVAEFAILDERLRPALSANGITDAQISSIRKTIADGRSVEDTVTDDMVDLFGIAGTLSDCKKKIENLREAGITQLVIGRPGQDNPQMMRTIGDHIMSDFR
jgi:5,10-methylenetetrahydromethanopterin reductase